MNISRFYGDLHTSNASQNMAVAHDLWSRGHPQWPYYNAVASNEHVAAQQCYGHASYLSHQQHADHQAAQAQTKPKRGKTQAQKMAAELQKKTLKKKEK
jgi:hypothetical protein